MFTKTYNMVDKEEGVTAMKLEERDASQTTIHVLSTPSLTGEGCNSYSLTLQLYLDTLIYF